MLLLDSHTFPLSGQQLIEASAGTGKTYTISSLYLRLLLGRDSSLTRPLLPSEILVLTFTIAATDELRERIRNRVSLARAMFAGDVSNTEDEFIARLISESQDIIADRRLLTASLQTMDEAAIFTIHGFCARVLGEQSFDTGMLFNQSLDGDRDQFLEMAAEDCFRQEIMPLPDSLRSIALKRWPNPSELVKFVKNFVFRHNLQYLPPEQDTGDGLDTLIEDNRRCKALWLEQDISVLIREANFWGGRLTIKQVSVDDPNFIEHYCHSDEFDIQRWLPWTSALMEKNSTKKTVVPKHEIFDLIDSIVERQSVLDTIGSNLCHQVTRSVAHNMATYKSRLGQLTLDDLLVEVHRALHGSQLGEVLRSRWPVAMIDEFQDTDDLQFEIFSRIYEHKATTNNGLFFIGDPKQAIYNFRGADVYTYINAKQSADNTYSLSTNWRSTPAMIGAVNHLFDQPDIFDTNGLIPFEPVQHALPNAKKSMTLNGEAFTPMPLFMDQASSENEMRENLMAHAAEETVRLLSLAQQGQACIDGKPIEPGQIAFLVRQRKDANAARRALAARNIRSVYVTLESVLLSETADDLKLILEAVIEPTNERALKTALGTRLLRTTVSEISALGEDWSALHDVMEEFQAYHQLWASMEIAPMIEHLVVRRQLAEKWLADQDGERQLTNLRHLTEILQTRSMVAPGMRRLLKWFQREKQNAESMAVDERQLRLESDSNLVQIVTMHASKGLEYDIVMIPYAGFGKPYATPYPMFHLEDQGGNFTPAIDFSNADSSKALYKEEDLNESMRLMYVAMTRARYCCYVGIPLIKDIKSTPIAKLLGFQSKEAEEIEQELCAALPNDLFTIQPLNSGAVTRYQPTVTEHLLPGPLAAPRINSQWRMHSYTGLTRLLKQEEPEHGEVQPRPGFGDDDSQSGSDADLVASAANALSRFTFPRGARVGIVLHDFMEQLDFGADPDTVDAQAKSSLGKMAVDDTDGEWRKVLCGWFKDIVTTPMSEQIPFTLADVDRSKRLDEMEFHFPVAATQSFIEELKASNILSQNMRLQVEQLKGMMTGYIDLIVAHGDRYYLIDYKSNDLGPSQTHYSSEELTEAVKHHHYDLQYLIYCVALNRYLTQRVPDYSYASHFGGVFYLFLRGMDGNAGHGVYANRPDEQLIIQLDQLLTAGAD
jgi:exodeoxyribonuclease V beta subunit